MCTSCRRENTQHSAAQAVLGEIICVDISAGADTGRVRVTVKISNGKSLRLHKTGVNLNG